MPFRGWDRLETIVADNYTIILLATALLFAILLFWIFALTRSNKKLWSRYQSLMAGFDNQNVEQMLLEYRKKTDACADRLFWLEQDGKVLAKSLSLAVQKVAVIRYNAFPEMGSDLSFSVALLDAQGDGVVVTSIYGREESRTFAKPILGGTSSYRLTEEENLAISKAMANSRA